MMYLLSFIRFIFVKDRATHDVLLRGRSRHGLYSLDVPAAPQVFSGVRVIVSLHRSGTLASIILPPP